MNRSVAKSRSVHMQFKAKTKTSLLYPRLMKMNDLLTMVLLLGLLLLGFMQVSVDFAADLQINASCRFESLSL